jgi:hypothetical protein
MDLFQFEWAVDQAGYDYQQGLSFETNPPRWTDPIIRARGGALRYYRPLEDHPGLWRRFATTCSSADGALDFVTQFGLPGDGPLQGPFGSRPPGSEPLLHILSTAGLIRQIADKLDSGNRKAAADLFTRLAQPTLTAGLVWPDREAFPEFKLVPRTLRGALLIQAGEAITGDRKFRRCRNDEWFQLGSGAHTVHREFCSDRCRVAWARRHRTKWEA